MTTVSHTSAPHAEDVDPADHGHPSDAAYWKVAGFLVVLTALEVSTYFWPHEWHKGAAVALIVMMVVKFSTVAAYFMHLKNDAVILRRLFIMGLVVALSVYFITLTTFTFWQESGVPGFDDPPRAKPLPPQPTEVPASIPASGGH
jgi:caa(3)-type oxidase subunit IV